MNFKPYLLLIFLCAASIAHAEITIILPQQQHYNSGDIVDASISIKEEEKQSAFFKMHMLCDSRDVEYYFTPVSLESGTRLEVQMPEIRIPEGALGTCKLRADLEKPTGEAIAASFSPQFQVSNEILVNVPGNFSVKPNETVIVTGEVLKENGKPLESGTATITFGDYKGVAPIADGKLAHAINVRVLPRGFYALIVRVGDQYGNGGISQSELKVEGIPTRIELSIENSNPIPGDVVLITPSIKDQTGDWLNKTLSLHIFDSDDQIILSQSVPGNADVSFPVLNTFRPGVYRIEGQLGSVRESSEINVQEYRHILMRQESSMVLVDNVGNVAFKDDVTILLSKGSEQLSITKKIQLDVGEHSQIDLSKEVGSGVYTIELPAAYSDPSLSLYGEASIDDNRNAIRKGMSGLSALTGFAVATTKEVVSKPLFAGILVGIIVLIIVLVYGKTVWRALTGKKDNTTDHIFEDFKYDR